MATFQFPRGEGGGGCSRRGRKSWDRASHPRPLARRFCQPESSRERAVKLLKSAQAGKRASGAQQPYSCAKCVHNLFRTRRHRFRKLRARVALPRKTIKIVPRLSGCARRQATARGEEFNDRRNERKKDWGWIGFVIGVIIIQDEYNARINIQLKRFSQ